MTQPSPLSGGNAGSLSAQFADFRPRLSRMVQLRMDPRLRSRIDASDVLQDAFFEASRRIERGERDVRMPFFVWVRFLTAQRLLQLHREHLDTDKRSAGREVDLASGAWGPDASALDLAGELADSAISPSRGAVRSEEIDRVRAALEELKPIDREVLALRHFEQLSNQETALVLGLLESAAAQRYLRALERLRTRLEPQ